MDFINVPPLLNLNLEILKGYQEDSVESSYWKVFFEKSYPYSLKNVMSR